MTRYAVDHIRRALIAQWGTGIGDLATVVVKGVPASSDLLRLAAGLTELSHACWRCYTHPASAADRHGPNSVGWHRQAERDAFGAVVPALLTPVRPDDVTLTLYSTRVEEAAHRVGRTLWALDAPRLAAGVATDVTAELAAIERAELGDLTARAQQAVTLSREDASPLQVAQADRLLHQHPFGAEALFTKIDPTAAAIAAAHWLYAAAATSARHTDLHPMRTIAEVDNLKAPAQQSLTEVMSAMSGGASPRHAVMPMIRNALHVAEGHLYDVAEAKHRIGVAEELIDRARTDHPDLGIGPSAVYLPITPLNPARPALDLLENLLYGIRSCWLTFAQHADASVGGRPQRRAEAFLDEVRKKAALDRSHLL
ncbi:MAG: hypothetical protein HOV96_24750 [Nonomuraea sp.]|nr:hypothetical protein [Nonomuraea sp.]NUP61393.1 hypothetical protein [Nonomuraea sp.]NUP80760.1 hypothetical protein [Nonomuraea sp.]NUS01819.1 hypothetical protein [Nonomuraea sp.]